ncbi:hypothetical protein PG984_005161 [Apiospora sp. TS-2023a]
MATPNASGNVASRTYQCAVCEKVLNSQKTLEQHTKTHLKQFSCGDCGESFARQDQIVRHRYKAHGHNASSIICYIKGCNRSRLGLQSEKALVTHLANSHQGATVADNKQAAALIGIQLPDESSNEEDSASDGDITMTEEEDSSGAESDSQEEPGHEEPGHEEPGQVENDSLSKEYYKYRVQMLEERLADCQDRLDKKDARHAREIADIHSFYQAKLADQEEQRAEQE